MLLMVGVLTASSSAFGDVPPSGPEEQRSECPHEGAPCSAILQSGTFVGTCVTRQCIAPGEYFGDPDAATEPCLLCVGADGGNLALSDSPPDVNACIPRSTGSGGFGEDVPYGADGGCDGKGTSRYIGVCEGSSCTYSDSNQVVHNGACRESTCTTANGASLACLRCLDVNGAVAPVAPANEQNAGDSSGGGSCSTTGSHASLLAPWFIALGVSFAFRKKRKQ